MIDYVTIEQGFDGTSVMVEPEVREGLVRRAFRYMANGALEWCALTDWRENNVRARFYGFHSRELPSTMTNA
jgi:hypothetical protein